MRNCAFLTMDSLEDFVCYDHFLYEPFKNSGWHVTEVSWRNRRVDWNKFDAVLVRSTWDYQDNPQEFLCVLQEIEQSSAHLENHISLIKWNFEKTYLQDLKAKKVQIIPTLWSQNIHDVSLFFDKLQHEEIVIKPTISANADNTFRLTKSDIQKKTPLLTSCFQKRSFMVQPFMTNIISEGEFSLFFFGNQYSHCILKTPKENDFRVQEEHGGILRAITADTSLIATAQNVMKNLPKQPLYARLDFVRSDSLCAQNSFLLMEVELIEPSLYFQLSPQAPQLFTDVFCEKMAMILA